MLVSYHMIQPKRETTFQAILFNYKLQNTYIEVNFGLFSDLSIVPEKLEISRSKK